MTRNVAVTHLADYATDPGGHLERRGRPCDPAAARAGRRVHAAVRGHRIRNVLVLGIGGVAAAALFAPHAILEWAWWLLEYLRNGFVWLMERL